MTNTPECHRSRSFLKTSFNAVSNASDDDAGCVATTLTIKGNSIRFRFTACVDSSVSLLRGFQNLPDMGELWMMKTIFLELFKVVDNLLLPSLARLLDFATDVLAVNFLSFASATEKQK